MLVRIQPPQLVPSILHANMCSCPVTPETIAAASFNHAQALRLLGLFPTGSNTKLLKRWLVRWQIPTHHFDARANRRPGHEPQPLETILVERSSYAPSNLKARLYRRASSSRSARCADSARCGVGARWG